MEKNSSTTCRQETSVKDQMTRIIGFFSLIILTILPQVVLGSEQLRFLYSNDIAGELKPCG